MTSKAGRVLFLLAAAAGLVALTFWLMSIGDDYHRENPEAREGAGRLLFIGQVLLTLLPTYCGWLCLRGAWMLMTESNQAPSSPPPTPPAQQPAPLSEEDQLAAAASQAWDRRKGEADAAYKAETEAVAEAHAKLARAKQLVEKSGVGIASMEILQTTWHWPSWSKRDDWRPPLDVEGIRALDDGGVAWIWQGFDFGLKLTKFQNYGASDQDSGDLVLEVNGEPVLKLDVYSKTSDDYDRWRFHTVSGLVPGPWMVALVDFAGALRVAEAKRQREWRDNYYTDKAAGIHLPARDED